ncbi:hypothetical protein [Brevifollis gellanilyticus]|uniref:Uncharacterized protein n=1 Tax=Brevifollis gellanilyticus TaxID=748831 RepID=A0A512MBQ0_9BACT|nr:hypothetical protein [Brevifollis gellanilyticus]GEP44144.1 hypothetical protein BGE01nite_34350 [Brevifollis gellanilyticus]
MPDAPEPPPRSPLYFIKREYESLEVRWHPFKDYVDGVSISPASGVGQTGGVQQLGDRHYLFAGLSANCDYRISIRECSDVEVCHHVGGEDGGEVCHTEKQCETRTSQQIYTRPPHLPLKIERLLSDPTESGVRVYWLIKQESLEPVEYDSLLRIQLGKLHMGGKDKYDYYTMLEFDVGANSHFFDFTIDLRNTYMLRCIAHVNLEGSTFKNESRWEAPWRAISLGGGTARCVHGFELARQPFAS